MAANRLTILGGWNEPMLVEVLQGLARESESLLESSGYDSQDLQELLFELNPAFNPVGQDEQPRLDQKAPITCPHCGQEFIPE